MASRNFEWRVSPRDGESAGRYILGGSTNLPLGVPVTAGATTDGLGRQLVTLATGAQDTPLSGEAGILDFVSIRFDGFDPEITTFSDVVDTVPVGESVIVASGDTLKGAWTNTFSPDNQYMYRTGYPKARIIIAGAGIPSPTVTVGEYLTPGVGNDTDGYWAVTANKAQAWLVVTAVDNPRGLVEARVNF